MKTRKELLKSPVRKWDDTDKEYDAILLVPAGTRHDSGWMHIAVIGVTRKEDRTEEYEICARPDDISCLFELDRYSNHKCAQVRMDCYYPQGILRYHGPGKFKVGPAISSVDITFQKSNQTP